MRTLLLFLIVIGSSVCFSQNKKELHVLFDFDSYEMRESERKKLEVLPEAAELELLAYTDTVGNNSYNLELSKKRLEAVKLELKKSGFLVVKTAFLGEENPIFNSYQETSERLSRRVVIFFSLPEKDTTVIEQSVFPKEPLSETQEELQREIDSIEVGEKIILKNMQFYGGRHYLLPNSHQSLFDLLAIMKANSELKIEIQGYVCCGNLGEDGYDFDLGTHNLSETRAQSIYNYLIQEGIEKDRLTYKGYGAGHNLVKEIDDYTKSVNRRVEIKILEK